ncbi:MAG: sugar phosphate nucleotidyltransferase [Candidatus Roizmanbacteria bacterium]
MKAVIFAGGVGTRLWPLSRKKSPKQFEKIIGNKSTLQLAVERLYPDFKPEDIFISTGIAYVELVAQQLSEIPKENIMGEPCKRDVGPAVAYVMAYLAKKFPGEAVIILWSDHLVKEEEKFKHIVTIAGQIAETEKNKIVFIGHRPRFASENLGWIETGVEIQRIGDVSFKAFRGFKYKPDKAIALQYFNDSKYCWNIGYFVTTPAFICSIYKKYSPEIYQIAEKIISESNNSSLQDRLNIYYKEMPEINFDNAVLEQLDPNYAYVIADDIGWSDVGAWEALKEALEEKREDNITRGEVLLRDSKDSLVYNYQDGKLVVGIDLEDLLVVNTEDVLLVSRKTSVGKIKKLVEGFNGTVHEKLT